MPVKNVPGDKKAKIMLYALSTCGWCRKVKTLLNELGIQYDYIDVDLTEGDERETVVAELTRVNPRRSFPTIVIDDGEVIVGFDKDRILEIVG
ncbi:glutaredoxin family protein [bacterium]|nr:glutaredoxin family protein [bacterium]